MAPRGVPDLRWHRVRIGEHNVSFGETGAGPPVVFLHGWGLTARSYARAFPLIAASGARVIAPALPGYGRSDLLDGEYTFPALARWLLDLLDHLGFDEPVTLVGHSFGGAVAAATAWQEVERVRALVLVNSVGGSVWKHSGSSERNLTERPLWDWGLRAPGEFRRRDYRRVLPVVVSDLLGNAVFNPAAMRRSAALARAADLRTELAELAAGGLPVSILWGSEDQVVPEATFLALCDAVGAPGDIIPQAGHSWLIADPAGFGELVTNSLTIQRTLHERTSGHRTDGSSEPSSRSSSPSASARRR